MTDNTQTLLPCVLIPMTSRQLLLPNVSIAEVVDHIPPVRLGGDFWDERNHQPLCHRCHNSKSGRESHTPVAY